MNINYLGSYYLINYQFQNLQPFARHQKHDKKTVKLNRAIGKLYELENDIGKIGVKSANQKDFVDIEKSIQEIIDNLNEFSTSHRNVSKTQIKNICTFKKNKLLK